jgi:hypothetical protein
MLIMRVGDVQSVAASPSRELDAVLSIVPCDVVTSLRALDPASSTALPLAASPSTAAAQTLGSRGPHRPHHKLLRTPGYRRGSSQGSSLSDSSRSFSLSTIASQQVQASEPGLGRVRLLP